jgi:hypothetical protein
MNRESVEVTVRAKILSYKNQLITKPIHMKDFANNAVTTGTLQRTTVNKEKVYTNIKN